MNREERINQLQNEIRFNKLIKSVYENSESYKRTHGIKPRIIGKLKVIR